MTGFGAFGRRGNPGAAAIAFVIFLMSVITPAAAQVSTQSDPAQSPPPALTAPDQEPSIYNYGTVDRSCLNWSDGCRICSYDQASSSAVCSNVGIACQPRELTCMTRRPDAGKE